MKKMDFSVSMCVYGRDNPDHFDAALESVIAQTFMPTEIVLVVDGFIPETIENVIEKYLTLLERTEIEFKVVRLEKNMGHGEARRRCFENCSYSLIALMDADDISVPKRFEQQICYFRRNPEVSVVGGYIKEFISAMDPKDTSRMIGSRIVPEKDREIKDFLRKRCPMNQVTVMFKKRDVSEIGGYIDWFCEEDYYLWIRLAMAGKIFGNIPDNLVDVRVGDEMYKRRGGMKYFRSEAGIQKYMLDHKLISFPRFLMNIAERFIVQVALPNKARGFIFRKFARN